MHTRKKSPKEEQTLFYFKNCWAVIVTSFIVGPRGHFVTCFVDRTPDDAPARLREEPRDAPILDDDALMDYLAEVRNRPNVY